MMMVALLVLLLYTYVVLLLYAYYIIRKNVGNKLFILNY